MNVSKSDREKKKSPLVTCPSCETQVLPNLDGTCPSCQSIIPQKEVDPIDSRTASAKSTQSPKSEPKRSAKSTPPAVSRQQQEYKKEKKELVQSGRCPNCGNSNFLDSLVTIDDMGNKTQIKDGYGLIGGILLIIFGIFLGWLGIAAFSSSYNASISPIIPLVFGFSSLMAGIRSFVTYFKLHNVKKAREYRCNNCSYVWYEQEGRIEINKEQLNAWSDEANQVVEEAKQAEYAKRTKLLESINNETGDTRLNIRDQQNAIINLLEQGDERAIQPLMKLMQSLAKTHPFKVVDLTGSAFPIIIKMGEKAVDPLIDIIQTTHNPSTLHDATRLLSTIGNPRAIEPIEQALKRVSWNTNEFMIKDQVGKNLKKLKSMQSAAR